jgi:ATP-binding cassette subfamily F protein 3
MIQISNLAKRYAGQILFEGVSFSINSGEKIGLVGRNGEGKSTFFKLLTGAEEADDGQISFPSGYRVGHLSQKLVFSEPTALEEALTALEGDAVWTDGHKVEAVLEGLGFDDQLKNTEPAKLSGGLQVRLNLAKLIASDPDLLLLDEPTNYLDIVSLRWLEKFLLAWRGELILITHDQGFLNKVISHTLGIHRKDFRKIAGPTSGYYSQLAMEEEVHEKSRLNQEKKIKETEKFINTFRAKASKAKAVQSRVKELEKMDKLDKLSEIDTLDFNFSHTAFPGKRMMEVREISFSWKEDQPLISDLSFTIGAKDRIGIIGKNGKGKTTLLRLLVGELQATSGEFQSAPKLESAYFGQTNVERLNQKATIEQELMSLDNCESITRARGAAGLMMFKGDDALKKISVLSGGEKSRVLLAKNILTPANILFLDEPTNH